MCQKVNRLLHNKKYSCHGEQNMPVSKTGFLPHTVLKVCWWHLFSEGHHCVCLSAELQVPCCSKPEGISCLTLTKLSFLRGLFYSILFAVFTLPTTSNWVWYNKIADEGIEILIIEDSHPKLGTYKYFQSVSILQIKEGIWPILAGSEQSCCSQVPWIKT